MNENVNVVDGKNVRVLYTGAVKLGSYSIPKVRRLLAKMCDRYELTFTASVLSTLNFESAQFNDNVILKDHRKYCFTTLTQSQIAVNIACVGEHFREELIDIVYDARSAVLSVRISTRDPYKYEFNVPIIFELISFDFDMELDRFLHYDIDPDVEMIGDGYYAEAEFFLNLMNSHDGPENPKEEVLN